MKFTDGVYNKSSDKVRIAKAWTRFLKGGLKPTQFTKNLYQHLHQHCGFIAHYNIHGFYEERFQDIDGRLRTFEVLCGLSGPYLRDENTSGNADLNQYFREESLRFLSDIAVTARDEKAQLLKHSIAQAQRELERMG